MHLPGNFLKDKLLAVDLPTWSPNLSNCLKKTKKWSMR